MPNYRALTILAELVTLDKELEGVAKVEKLLQNKDIAEGPKNSIEERRKGHLARIGQAVDRVLLACDVAEANNQAYCQYMLDVHLEAKGEMDKIQMLLPQLEKAWDTNKAIALRNAADEVMALSEKLHDDDGSPRLEGIPIKRTEATFWLHR
jgi:hypothetical protein